MGHTAEECRKRDRTIDSNDDQSPPGQKQKVHVNTKGKDNNNTNIAEEFKNQAIQLIQNQRGAN